MARDLGAVCRICRTEGQKLFFKGDRCFTTKCSFEKRSYWPGMHGKVKSARLKMSDFGTQLRQKQKLRKSYGMLERQFAGYFEKALKTKGVTGIKLLQLLESRLDNMVMRMGFTRSRAAARQLVLHGHITVDGKKVTIPSYQLKPGNEIAVRETSTQLGRCKESYLIASSRGIPDWVKVDPEKAKGTYLSLPTREQLPADIQENMVVEFYSR
ncbi:MAG: 30S ribosomal protein S4 [Candidatus Wallbacteria bacterium]|nr:30S ribosomal protein S4 [Candidatus Wallbacteria bacterium]